MKAVIYLLRKNCKVFLEISILTTLRYTYLLATINKLWTLYCHHRYNKNLKNNTGIPYGTKILQ